MQAAWWLTLEDRGYVHETPVTAFSSFLELLNFTLSFLPSLSLSLSLPHPTPPPLPSVLLLLPSITEHISTPRSLSTVVVRGLARCLAMPVPEL